jgi:hypothetical protein
MKLDASACPDLPSGATSCKRRVQAWHSRTGCTRGGRRAHFHSNQRPMGLMTAEAVCFPGLLWVVCRSEAGRAV